MEAVDLTLPKLFAGDHDPRLLYQNHREARGRVESNRRILSMDTGRRVRIHSDFDLLIQYDIDSGILQEPVDGHDLLEAFTDLYRRLFGRRHPIEMRMYLPLGNGENCDCCGTRLTLINKVFHLCQRCDDRTSREFRGLVRRLFPQAAVESAP